MAPTPNSKHASDVSRHGTKPKKAGLRRSPRLVIDDEVFGLDGLNDPSGSGIPCLRPPVTEFARFDTKFFDSRQRFTDRQGCGRCSGANGGL